MRRFRKKNAPKRRFLSCKSHWYEKTKDLGSSEVFLYLPQIRGKRIYHLPSPSCLVRPRRTSRHLPQIYLFSSLSHSALSALSHLRPFIALVSSSHSPSPLSLLHASAQQKNIKKRQFPDVIRILITPKAIYRVAQNDIAPMPKPQYKAKASRRIPLSSGTTRKHHQTKHTRALFYN